MSYLSHSVSEYTGKHFCELPSLPAISLLAACGRVIDFKDLQPDYPSVWVVWAIGFLVGQPAARDFKLGALAGPGGPSSTRPSRRRPGRRRTSLRRLARLLGGPHSV